MRLIGSRIPLDTVVYEFNQGATAEQIQDSFPSLYGEVYVAHDTQLERPVALKILPANLAGDQQRMFRLLQEAKAAANLLHQNIAHVYEIRESNGVNFIAMEYIEGETLRQLQIRSRRGH